MSHWRRLSRKRRTLVLVIAVLALAATALASTRLAPSRNATADKAEKQEGLGGTMPPPADVFLQQTGAFPELGNVLLTVRLTPEQVAAKQRDGTVLYTTLGSLGEILFRDDGEVGDAIAGDGLYTAMARVDIAELKKRAAQDAAALKTASATIPLFRGRAIAGSQTQTAFDIAAFRAGQAVRLSPAVIAADAKSKVAIPVSQARVLMIRDPNVLNDPLRTVNPCNPAIPGNPNGVWTFKHLMTEMANDTGQSPSDFTVNWLYELGTHKTINGTSVPARTEMNDLLADWRRVSGGVAGEINLDLAPFRLLAIVPRLDLRRVGAGGGNFLDAGEVRFIFGLVRPSWATSFQPQGNNAGGCYQSMSVSFEYKVARTKCLGVTGWAQQWTALAGLVPGGSYNQALEQLTEPLVTAGAGAIARVLTNDRALASPWQLRAFLLAGDFDETVVAETPADAFNAQPLFQSWLAGQVIPAISGPGWNQPIPFVPVTYQATPFRGPRPEMPNASFYWVAPNLDYAASGGNNARNWGRYRASIASCNGCHAGETGTSFAHLNPLTSELSGFLTGITVADPANSTPQRGFSDLKRRFQDIHALANTLCLQAPPIDVVQVRDSLAQTGKLPKYPFPGVIPADQFLPLAADDLKADHITEVH